MVSFALYDNDGDLIEKIDARDDPPDNASTLTITGPFDISTSSYKFLTTMLKSSHKKFDNITIDSMEEEDESPEFLTFLLLICNKTSALDITDCSLSTNATTCLMAALLSRDGISSLSWMTWSMPTDQLKILLEGVASASCLESFELDISQIESNQVVGRYLVQALQRNKSLKNISLRGVTRNEPTIFQDILKASILGPNVKAVFIHDSSAPTLRVDVLQDVLCRKDCTLEKLHLHGINVLTGDRWNGSIIQNLSVTNLRVSGSTHDSDSISKIISLFKSLEELDISNNHSTELSFLDPLFFGKRSTLKLLDVSRNIIEEEEMKCFIEKLRNIRGLKSLGFWYEGLRDSDSIKTALYCALRNNTDLECVDFPRRDLPLDLNRGGRRAFESSQ